MRSLASLRTFLGTTTTILLLAWTSAPVEGTVSQLSQCRAVGVSGTPPKLRCNGPCATGQTCDPKDFDDGENGHFKACSCTDAYVTDNCCQLILDSSGNITFFGDCPSCGTTGTCSVEDNQAKCD